MSIQMERIGADSLARHGAIPTAFTVESVLRVDVVDQGLGGLTLSEECVSPYVKDYDAVAEDGERVLDLPCRWDVRRWAQFLAVECEQDVGGAVVAVATPGMGMLEGRTDLACLWDIRVHPDARRRGIGSELFKHAANWARGQGLRQLKIETQNINVPACRFYARQGCELGMIHRLGYSGCARVAHEAMLIWYLDL